MKKAASLLLVLLLALSLTACGGGDAPDAPDTQDTPPEADAQITSVNLGETVSLDFVEFTFNDDFGHGTSIKEGNTTLDLGPAEGIENYWLHGTLTNTTGEAYDITNNGFVEIVFDGTYTYKGRAYMVNSMEAAPLADCSVYLVAEVPPRAFESAQEVAVRFAFNNNFEKFDYSKGSWDDISGYDYVYEYVKDLSAAPAAPAGPEAVDADTIDAALQGTWTITGGSFIFSDGSADVKFDNGQSLSGSYTVDTDGAQIVGTFTATDGTTTIRLPYTYSGDTLSLYNNNGQPLTKQ